MLAAAELLERRGGKKTTAHLCRSRVDKCVKRSVAKGAGLRVALVAVDGNEKVRGFLYAQESNFFDLCPNIRAVEVLFLVGSHGAAVPLLTRLRSMTNQRILVQSWALLKHRPRAFRRLLRSLGPEPVAVTYQL